MWSAFSVEGKMNLPLQKQLFGLMGVAGLALSVSVSLPGAREEKRPDDLLLAAIQQGDSPAVRALLKKGVDANAKDAEGTPALMLAALYADASTMRALLEAGAQVDARDRTGATALIWAAADAEK